MTARPVCDKFGIARGDAKNSRASGVIGLGAALLYLHLMIAMILVLLLGLGFA